MELIDEGQARVIEAMQRMSDADQNKFLRFVIRLLNNDSKAIRYAEMRQSGQISFRQFLDAM